MEKHGPTDMRYRIERTTNGLRNYLFDQLDCLANGEISVAKANAISRTVITIIATVHLEMEARKLNYEPGSIDNVDLSNRPGVPLS